MVLTHGQDALLSFSNAFQLLGPFQIGTREASWGADPLESLGGFRSLESDPQAAYPSSLGPNGLVGWSIQHLEWHTVESYRAEAGLVVAFPDIDWAFLQSVYGWAALQYQAWARGHLIVTAEKSQTILLYTDNVLEFRVNNTHYFGGDFYAFRRSALVLHLEPGKHKLDVRLIRDVRAMGAVGEPKVSIILEAIICEGGLAVEWRRLLVPEVIDGCLASPFASVPVRNDGSHSIEILHVTATGGDLAVEMLSDVPLRVAPGQTRPLGLRLAVNERGPRKSYIVRKIKVTYVEDCSSDHHACVLSAKGLVNRNIHEPHKLTFLHPSGVVSYAILRPPSSKVASEVDPDESLPILMNLHGAGLEADSDQVREMLDALPDLRAWVLYPTGVTPWSADDWHTWGFADVEAAVEAVMEWIKAARWEGPSVASKKWLVSGHSNGGQGTWYALTHRPDNIIGAAPVSGYSSIQAYVPYQMWRETDPKIVFMLRNSLQSFRHELLIANVDGIPILQQHGGLDDNVPAFHSRRMNQLVQETCESSNHKYVELDGKGHWFDGVMSTAPLRRFYESVLAGSDVARLPQKFSITVADPGDMTIRGGLVVDQLVVPDQLGKIDVQISEPNEWTLSTSNIECFHFTHMTPKPMPSWLVIDGTQHQLPQTQDENRFWFVRDENNDHKRFWRKSCSPSWKSTDRHGAQLGALHSFLRTRGPFLIEERSPAVSAVSLQISRNLFQYLGADSEILDYWSIPTNFSRGNIVNVAMGEDFSDSSWQAFVDANNSVHLVRDLGLRLRSVTGPTRTFELEPGLGVIFLRPLPNEGLELIVWGHDDKGLRQAARLIPMLTGVGQPEFIVVSSQCAWRGAAGVLAMGSFDKRWDITPASFKR